jgi:hypothetical protein
VIGLPLSSGVVIVHGGVAEKHGGVHDVVNPVSRGKLPCVPVRMAMVKVSIRTRDTYLLTASVQTELLGTKRSIEI